MTRRDGFETKLRRAERHVDELEGQVRGFLSSDPFVLCPEDEVATGDLVFRVRLRARPPMEWSSLIGDAVHNARSALDHVAWALVEAGGGMPGEHTCFPIADHEQGYGDKLRKGLRGASVESRQAVRTLKPWRGGDDLLWQLHRLDIIDKHRLLIPVGAANRGIVIGGTFAGFGPGDAPVPIPPIHLNAADRQYPLADGTEVFRVMAAAREAQDSPFQWKHGVTFEVAFGEGSVVQGEPLVPGLRKLVSHVEEVVSPLLDLTDRSA